MQKNDHYDRIGWAVKEHWTARYLWDRVREYAYRKLYPNNPWLTPQAITFMQEVIQHDYNVLEFGSGRSTIWFSQRCQTIVSFEDDRPWFDFINNSLSKLPMLKYNLIDKAEEGYYEKFIEAIRELPDSSFDLCLVDGCPRGLCAYESIVKVKKGGFLVIDNANWFLPNDSRSPSSVRNEVDIPLEFKGFYEATKSWTKLWTSNGVTDTLILTKP